MNISVVVLSVGFHFLLGVVLRKEDNLACLNLPLPLSPTLHW